MEIPDWIVPVLQRERNVSLPVELVEKYGIKRLESYLTSKCTFEVKIRVDKVVNVEDFATLEHKKWISTFYIAEKVRNKEQ